MEKMNINKPPQRAAVLKSPCTNSAIKVGKMGMMMPNPVTSINKVMKMKVSPAFLFSDILFFFFDKKLAIYKAKLKKLLKKSKNTEGVFLF